MAQINVQLSVDPATIAVLSSALSQALAVVVTCAGTDALQNITAAVERDMANNDSLSEADVADALVHLRAIFAEYHAQMHNG